MQAIKTLLKYSLIFLIIAGLIIGLEIWRYNFRDHSMADRAIPVTMSDINKALNERIRAKTDPTALQTITHGTPEEAKAAILKQSEVLDQTRELQALWELGQPVAAVVVAPAPQTIPPEALAILPATPTEVKPPVLVKEDCWRYEWPTKAHDWVKVITLLPGQVVEADPNGKIWAHPNKPVMGPAGTDYLCTVPKLCGDLPVPAAPPYSLVAKLGAHGTPVPLAGKYGKSLQAIQEVDLYVRVNDLPPGGSFGPGVALDEGSLPVLVINKK